MQLGSDVRASLGYQWRSYLGPYIEPAADFSWAANVCAQSRLWLILEDQCEARVTTSALQLAGGKNPE